MTASARPIFVIGVPRSGTTLLSSMIASHPHIYCGPETQFFNKLSRKRLSKCVNDPNWPSLAVKSLTNLSLANQDVLTLYGVNGRDLTEFLNSSGPSVAAMLEGIVARRQESSGKARWAEKTPDHMLSIIDIARAFPQAKFVHVVRDPRDVSRSMRSLSWASPSPLANAWVWRSWLNEMSLQVSIVGADVCTIRYEDLLADPQAQLERFCAHVGEPFSVSMLDHAKGAGSVVSPNEAWKAGNTQPLAPGRAFAWKQGQPNQLDIAIGQLCRGGIDQYRYTAAEPAGPGRDQTLKRLNRHKVELRESELTSMLVGGWTVDEGGDTRRLSIGAVGTGKNSSLPERAQGWLVRKRPVLAHRYLARNLVRLAKGRGDE